MKNVMQIFNQVQKAYQRYCYRAVAPLGIKMSEMLCILFLYNSEGQDTAHAIAEQYQLSPSMVSKSLESLKRAGLIETKKDEMDSRIAHIHLTEQAKPVIAQLSQAQTHFIAEIAQGISTEDFNRVIRLAEQMQNNLCGKSELSGRTRGNGRVAAAHCVASNLQNSRKGALHA